MDHSVCQPVSKPLSQPIHLFQSASQSACQPDNQLTQNSFPFVTFDKEGIINAFTKTVLP